MFTESKTFLSSNCEIQFLGAVKHNLNWKIDRTNTSLAISQPAYITDILTQTNMLTSKPASTPCPAGYDLRPRLQTEAPLNISKYPYAKVLGRLRYLAGSTRPDIAFSVGFLARFQSDPTYRHWKAIKHLLR